MINCDYIKRYLEINCYSSCFTFDYQGKPCGIDPIAGGFNVWYDDNDYRAEKLDDVFTVKLFGGKTLPEIVDKITDYDTFTEDEY